MNKLSSRIVQRIKDHSIELFKQKQFQAYEPELQATICTLLAAKAILEQELGIQLPIEALQRLPYSSVDDL